MVDNLETMQVGAVEHRKENAGVAFIMATAFACAIKLAKEGVRKIERLDSGMISQQVMERPLNQRLAMIPNVCKEAACRLHPKEITDRIAHADDPNMKILKDVLEAIAVLAGSTLGLYVGIRVALFIYAMMLAYIFIENGGIN